MGDLELVSSSPAGNSYTLLGLCFGHDDTCGSLPAQEIL